VGEGADDLNAVIEEAILLELNVADLYLLFYRQFPEDSQFWWQLAIEEKNHAALLRTLSQMRDSRIPVAEELLPTQIQELRRVNLRLQETIVDMEVAPPERARAFQLAYAIENSAGELHYEKFIRNQTSGPVSAVFKKLNGEDINHANRICQYMSQHQIEPGSQSEDGL
jgi:hypothetical protein